MFKSRSDQKTNHSKENSNSFRNLWINNWFKVLIIIFALLIFFFIWEQINQKILLLFFTILPLFLGYGFSFLLEPIIHFFSKFFSLKLSRIIVFIFFVLFILALVLGLFFLFFVQINDLYRIFFYKKGGDEFQKFLIQIKETEGDKITDLKFYKQGQNFILKYKNLDESPEKIITISKDEVAGIFVLLLKIAVSLSFLKTLCFAIISWIYSNLADYAYLTLLFNNIEIIFLFLFLFFFTVIIAGFSIGKGTIFFNKFWNFLTHNYDQEISNKLKIRLRKNLGAWAKGLLIVQLYILIFSGLFIFVGGIIFASTSSYDDSAIVLTLFMSLCNLVPYIGPTVGFLPIITVGLIDIVNNGISLFSSWVPFIIAVGGCLLVQAGESALVSPFVYSRQAKVEPVTVIIGLAITGVLFGVWAMPLAIPIILIFKVIYKTIYQEKLPQKESELSTT